MLWLFPAAAAVTHPLATTNFSVWDESQLGLNSQSVFTVPSVRTCLVMSTRFSGSLDDAINNFKDVVSSLDFSTYGKIRGFSSFGFGFLNRQFMLIYICLTDSKYEQPIRWYIYCWLYSKKNLQYLLSPLLLRGFVRTSVSHRGVVRGVGDCGC